MLLDTGAMMIQINPALAAKIVMEKQGSYGRWANFTMADGRSVKQQVLNIESVRIGNHTLHNVEASVSEGTLLMAFPVLNAIGPFKIDTRNRELVFDSEVASR
jgi:predicted aspartyl protease